ncbi:MAG: TerB family tellurite resistance protein [Ignavibacteriales bacterium]|nr:TerB family tellurite resistance protein [Ignavibacteriales bacterium]
MFEYLRKIFADNQTPINQSPINSSSESKNQKIEIAACALFIEIAKADGEFTDEERKFIISEMKSTFNLDDDYVNDLILLAEQRVKESVSLYEFTGVINTTFTFEEKIELIESLWKLIYKDEKLNQYEDHLIKRIAATINIEHKQIINAKLWVKEQMGLK